MNIWGFGTTCSIQPPKAVFLLAANICQFYKCQSEKKILIWHLQSITFDWKGAKFKCHEKPACLQPWTDSLLILVRPKDRDPLRQPVQQQVEALSPSLTSVMDSSSPSWFLFSGHTSVFQLKSGYYCTIIDVIISASIGEGPVLWINKDSTEVMEPKYASKFRFMLLDQLSDFVECQIL